METAAEIMDQRYHPEKGKDIVYAIVSGANLMEEQ